MSGIYSRLFPIKSLRCKLHIALVQWRETRTIGTSIKDLQAQLPGPDAEGNAVASPLDGEVAALKAVRTPSSSRPSVLLRST